MKIDRILITALLLSLTAGPPLSAKSGAWSPGDDVQLQQNTCGVMTKFLSNPFSDVGLIAYAVAVQSDGGFLVGGNYQDAANATKGFVSRYSASGQLDAAFGNGGTAILPFFVEDLALDADGTILTAGYGQVQDFYLARLEGNGVLASNFGNAGIVSTDFHGESDRAHALAVAEDGRIFATGFVYENGLTHFGIASYSANGILEAKSNTDLGPNADVSHAVAIDSSGKALSAGAAGSAKAALIRYNSDLSLDTSFGDQGKVLTDFGYSGDQNRALAIDDSGRILTAGWACLYEQKCEMVVARHLPADGGLDTTFGDGGLVKIVMRPSEPVPYDVATAVAIQNDGKIVVAGSSVKLPDHKERDVAALRLDTNGSLDTTFGTNGRLLIDFGHADYAHDVAIQADGSLVIVGFSYDADADQRSVAVARYKPCPSDGTTQIQELDPEKERGFVHPSLPPTRTISPASPGRAKAGVPPISKKAMPAERTVAKPSLLQRIKAFFSPRKTGPTSEDVR